MWIVELALRRPHTFIVLALLIVVLGLLSLFGTSLSPGIPADVLPEIRIPIIGVTFWYSGMPADEMASRITDPIEQYATTQVSDIEHVESQTYPGNAVVKLFFRPGVDIDLAMAQTIAFVQLSLSDLPTGTTPPILLKFNASSVPVIQLALSSRTLPESQVVDLGNRIVRAQVGTIAGASLPYPYGGAIRQIQVDLRPSALRAQGLTASEVSAAIGEQNPVIPAGTQKIGDTEYAVKLRSGPRTLEEINELPVRSRKDGTVTYLRDVAFAHDGHAPQTNIVRVNGSRAVLMSVLKTGSASSLAIVDEIKARLPHLRELLPTEASITTTADQSVFVRAAVHRVLAEVLISAALTALLVLLFLGRWRSTLIVTISIPLSILASLTLLRVVGETVNLMTLGGLALAVGILVDDATVAIESISRQLEAGKELERAILDGSRQIAMPALVSTLAICIVFAPMALLSGVARYLFVPLAEAVVFAVLTSFLLSRTLIPTLCRYWLRGSDQPSGEADRPSARFRILGPFQRAFEYAHARYARLLSATLQRGPRILAVSLALAALSLLMVPLLGRDFFPEVDSGQIRLHVRARTGTRVENTAGLIDRVEAALREVIPASEIASVIDNIGLPNSSINLTYTNSGTVGSSDADVLVALAPTHAPTADYVRLLRQRLPQQFPGVSFAFLPADVISQILNLGAPASFDIQVRGSSPRNPEIADHLLEALRGVPGLVDLRIQQESDRPEIRIVTDRSRAQQFGITQQGLANDLLLTLSGNGQVGRTFWLNPESAEVYPLVTQAPEYHMSSLDDLRAVPVGSSQGQLLGGLASISRGFGPAVVSHYDTEPVIDILGTAQDRDLGAIRSDALQHIGRLTGHLPRGTQVILRGQVQTMASSYRGLALGFLGAVGLVYLLMVISLQSWTDPLIVLSAIPPALAGIAWTLPATSTPLSVPALIGAVMCIGVATANSILIVSVAREFAQAGSSARQAAYEAGLSRFRPVLMTACAMIVGMLPTALGMGSGGEENAPLGRAVIGGLLFATVATLLLVPAVFSAMHRQALSQ